MTFIKLLVAALLIVGGFFIWKKYFKWRDAKIKMPDVLRTDINVGWYGSISGKDLAETQGHTNVFWFCHFFPIEEFVDAIRGSSQKIVFELAKYLVSAETSHPGNGHRLISPTAEEDLRAGFQYLKDQGVLHQLTYLTVIDEPQLTLKNKTTFEAMLLVAKKVASEFEELKDVRWLCMYFHETEFWHLEHMDIVGVDSYDQKSMVLTKGEHARLMKEKAPHQKVMIVPGAGFGQNPDDFVAYAHKTPDVEMLVPFLYFADKNHGTDGSGKCTGIAAASEKFRNKWIEACKLTMNR